jgi:eukaryotic-like serine/threonine-protein kinase
MEAGRKLLAGRYQLGRLRGADALGQVVEAYDRTARRPVAVRIAHPQVAADSDAGAGFLQAAREATRLDHPNIVAVLDLGEDGGVPFLVMELVEGRTMRQALRTSGVPPVERAVEIAAQVCSALGAAHAQGLIHGGLTPDNVLGGRHSPVRVMDFGLAALVSASAPEAVRYRSPEQVQSGQADDRSDLYALGCCLFELLTGEPPFDGPTPFAVMRRHLEERPRPPSALRPEVPAELDELVLRALAKYPHERPQTAAELRHGLARLRRRPPAPVAAAPVVTPTAAKASPVARTADETEGHGAEATPPVGPWTVSPPGSGRGTAPPPAPEELPPHEERVQALTRFAEPPGSGNRLAVVALAVGLAIILLATIGLVAPGLVVDVGPGAASNATTATTSPPAPRTVPALTGLAQAEAARRLRALGTKVGTVRLARNTGLPKGLVASTTPPAGAILKGGQAVDLAVSNGSDPATVGDLIGVIDEGPASQIGPRGQAFRRQLVQLDALRGERRRQEVADLLRIARAGGSNGDLTPEFSRKAVEVLSRTE